MIKSNKSLLITLVLILFFESCSVVKPWEKENLASAQMSFEPLPQYSKFTDHVYTSREASFGGYGGGVNGCGCK